jgi:hypothetical protein
MSSDSCCGRDLIGDTPNTDRGICVWVTSTLRDTARSRVGLIGSALVALCAFAIWTASLLWATPALFVVVFLAKLLDRHARQSALRRARAMPMRLPELTEFSEDAVRGIMQRLVASRNAIGQVLDAGPHGPGFELASSLRQVPQLERDVVVLARRAEYVAKFLSANPLEELLAEARRHEERLQREPDPVRADILRRAGAHLKARLASTAALLRQYETLVGAASNALGALEELPSKMMLLQLGRLEACHAPSALDAFDSEEVDVGLQEIERDLASDRAP